MKHINQPTRLKGYFSFELSQTAVCRGPKGHRITQLLMLKPSQIKYRKNNISLPNFREFILKMQQNRKIDGLGKTYGPPCPFRKHILKVCVKCKEKSLFYILTLPSTWAWLSFHLETFLGNAEEVKSYETTLKPIAIVSSCNISGVLYSPGWSYKHCDINLA